MTMGTLQLCVLVQWFLLGFSKLDPGVCDFYHMYRFDELSPQLTSWLPSSFGCEFITQVSSQQLVVTCFL